VGQRGTPSELTVKSAWNPATCVSVEAAATLETIAPIERLATSDMPVEPQSRARVNMYQNCVTTKPTCEPEATALAVRPPAR